MIIGISGKIGSGKDTVGKVIQLLLSEEEDFRNFIKENPKAAIEDWNGYFDNLGTWKNKKFADKLKDMICLMIGCTRGQLEDRVFKETPLPEIWWYYKSGGIVTLYPDGRYKEFGDKYLVKTTPRLLLQQMGTECGRNIIHPNVWVNALMADYRIEGQIDKGKTYSESDYPNWIITDMRFPNELNAIKNHGITIRVQRPCPECGMINAVGTHFAVCSQQRSLHPSETELDHATFDYLIENNGTLEDLIEKVKQILIKEKII